MYKLYTDKQENFQCSIELSGVSLSKSQARLVVETSDINLMRVLISENINLKNLSVKRTKLNTVIAEYIQSNPVEQEQVQPIVEKVIKVLTKKR